jgi:hypothetical protein
VVAALRRAGSEMALCWRFATALVVVFFCCRSHSKFWRKLDVSSCVSMRRLVVRGDIAGGCTLEVVMMMGFGFCLLGRIMRPSSWGELPMEGPLGVVVRERLMAEVDREASFCSARARSPSWSAVVSRERCDWRFDLDSTRWNMPSSLGLAMVLSSSLSSSSQSESSSSMALSSTSSSLSLSMAPSLSEVMS